MTTYTPQEIRILVHNYGFRGDDEVTMTAIVLAESGGDPNKVHGNKDGSQDYGLAQINSSHFGEALDTGLFGSGILKGTISLSNVLDPQINLEFANKLYKARGNKFTDWVAYTSGTYAQFLGQVNSSTKTPAITGDIPTDVTNTATSAITSAASSAIGALGPMLTKIAFVGTAATLVGLGLWKVTAGPRKTAGGALPVIGGT